MTQKLPDKDTLEREYLAGASFTQLGEKYGVSKKTVYNTMIRRARAAGTPWPLKQRDPRWREKAAAKHRADFHDGVTAVMVRLEILDVQTLTGVSRRQIALGAGVHPSVVSAITTGARKSIKRSTAEAIMAEIERLEKAHNRRVQARHALDVRNRKWAAEKAAGTRPLSQRDLRNRSAA